LRKAVAFERNKGFRNLLCFEDQPRTHSNKKALVSAALIVALPALAMAQQQGGGTDQERKACSPDVTRYCSKVADQGDLVVLSCLQQNRPKISPACNKFCSATDNDGFSSTAGFYDQYEGSLRPIVRAFHAQRCLITEPAP
jgi:hypothetical protein